MSRNDVLKRALFVVHTRYLYLEPYRRVISALSSERLEISLLFLQSVGTADNDQTSPRPEDSSLGSVHSIAVTYPPLGDGPVRHGRYLVDVLRVRWKLKCLLRRERPDVVVVGVDVVDFFNRAFLDECQRCSIPVVIVAVALPGPKQSNPAKRLPWPILTTPLLRVLGLERAASFTGWILGSYHPTAIIAIESDTMRNELIGLGVSAERLVTTGNPVHDVLHELLQEDAEWVRRRACSSLGWASDTRLIVYATERIQDIYGLEYLASTNAALASAFDHLSPDCKVIVKLHPREPEDVEAAIRETFAGPRYHITRTADIHTLVRAADLTLAHYSTVLHYASVLARPLLTIGLRGERETTIEFGAGDGLVRIASLAELPLKIHSILSDPAFRESAVKTTSGAERGGQRHLDGYSARRVAELIQRVAGVA